MINNTMKKRHVVKRDADSHEVYEINASGISDEDIRKRAYEIYLERESHEGTPEDDWKKSEEELYSDLGF